jgi:ribosomal protein S6
MANYEMALVVVSTGESEAIEALKKDLETILKKYKGKVVSVDEWGEKLLTYKIKKHDRGYYLIYQLEVSPQSVHKIKKLLIQDKRVLRILIIKK